MFPVSIQLNISIVLLLVSFSFGVLVGLILFGIYRKASFQPVFDNIGILKQIDSLHVTQHQKTVIIIVYLCCLCFWRCVATISGPLLVYFVLRFYMPITIFFK